MEILGRYTTKDIHVTVYVREKFLADIPPDFEIFLHTARLFKSAAPRGRNPITLSKNMLTLYVG